MGKVIRLTESQLKSMIKRVIEENKTGGDIDHFGKIVLPKMKQSGFKLFDDSKIEGGDRCRMYNGNCCKYFAYPEHNNGVNLFLSCEDGGWKYVVFTHPGNKNLKEFGWKTGTEQEVMNAANQAVNYAIQLKNKMFGTK